jgi:crossover junction endodeoxyribonuclease RuvC
VGIDPGLANLGLGAVEERGRTFHHLGDERVVTKASTPQGDRLQQLYQATQAFLAAHRPEAVAIEGQYFHRQREASFKVGQAVGVCLLAVTEAGVPIFEYGPMQVKQTLVGSGRASKEQVAFMVRGMLQLTTMPKSSHVADALALALTHLSFRRIAPNQGSLA